MNKKSKQFGHHSKTQSLNDKSIHIALVANTSWSVYNFRIGLIRSCLAKGHKVSVIAPMDDYSSKLTAEGVTYIPVQVRPYSQHPWYDIKALISLIRIYREHRFDLVLHYTIKMNIFGTLAAHIAGCRSISVVTGLGQAFEFKGWKKRLVHILYRFAFKRNEEVWFLNTENQSHFINHKLVAQKKTFLLPSEGIDTSKFTAGAIPVFKRHTRFLFAGRLLKNKGILEFVEAAKIIRSEFEDVKFEVAGFVFADNPNSVSLDELERWQRSGAINYLGSREDIRPFIERSDCIVFPSYYQEGISRILLEAASMSRPIITTDHTGCRDVVIDGQNGYLVPPRSVEDLVNAIRQFLLTDPIERNIMGQKGRTYVQENFDASKVNDLYFSRLIDPISQKKAEQHIGRN